MFDHRVLLLTHTGRKTGKIRRNGIEVIHYDLETKESVVISAYSTRSDWYRNIAKSPTMTTHCDNRTRKDSPLGTTAISADERIDAPR
jgi:deazaflavin-dependent oxidoreductase (nitroreductase family)